MLDCRLGVGGLEHDRQFMVVSSAAVCVTQKRAARLCLIQPSFTDVSLPHRRLLLSHKGKGRLQVMSICIAPIHETPLRRSGSGGSRHGLGWA